MREDRLAAARVLGYESGETGVRGWVDSVGGKGRGIDGAVGEDGQGTAAGKVAHVEGVAVGRVAGETGGAGLAVGEGEEDGVAGGEVGDGGADGEDFAGAWITKGWVRLVLAFWVVVGDGEGGDAFLVFFFPVLTCSGWGCIGCSGPVAGWSGSGFQASGRRIWGSTVGVTGISVVMFFFFSFLR